MNERLAAGIFFGLSVGLIVTETVLASVFGLQVAIIMFCFIIYAGLSGVVFSLRFLLQKRGDIESVSTRRARALKEEGMDRILKGYDIDEEFLDRSGRRKGKPVKSAVADSGEIDPSGSGISAAATLEDTITAHARMFGGLEQLLAAVMHVDGVSFDRLARTAGISGVSREELTCVIKAMAAREKSHAAGNECAGSEGLLSISLDRADFDDYIKRCMTEGENSDDHAGAGFSLDLESGGGARAAEPSPSEFSHDPRSVISRFKKSGSDS
jgi:hypothetical protein